MASKSTPINLMIILLVGGAAALAALTWEQGTVALKYSSPVPVTLEEVAQGEHPPGAWVSFEAARDPRLRNHIADEDQAGMRWVPLLPGDEVLKAGLEDVNKAEVEYIKSLQAFAEVKNSTNSPGPVFNSIEELEGKTATKQKKLGDAVEGIWGHWTVAVYEKIPADQATPAGADPDRPWIMSGLELVGAVFPEVPQYPDVEIEIDATTPERARRSGRKLFELNKQLLAYYTERSEQVYNELESWDASMYFMEADSFEGVVGGLPDSVKGHINEVGKPNNPVFWQVKVGEVPSSAPGMVLICSLVVVALGLLVLVARIIGGRRSKRWEFDDED